MKKKRMDSELENIKWIGIIAIIYMALVIGFTYITYNNLLTDLREELGNKAMILAVDISKWVKVDQEEYNRILKLDFNALLKDDTNINFEKNARSIMVYSRIKYIYIESQIPKSAVKYVVEPGQERMYNASVKTPLDVVYLLDAVVSDQVRMEDTKGQWYTDRDRYTVMTENYKKIYQAEEPTYLINEDQWGTYITGYAPLYMEDGTFIGMVGVDLFLDSYYAYIQKNIIIFTGFVLTLVFATMGLFYVTIRMGRAEERVRIEKELAATDALTGILNRRSFNELVHHEINASRREQMPISLLVLDIDHFKQVNDCYGHSKGDQILIGIADILKKNVKRASDILARYGGDEFVVVLHNTDEAGARIIANRILTNIKENNFNTMEEKPLYITATIGISTVIPKDELAFDTLFQQADSAYYVAKENGGGQYETWVHIGE